ncbi:zinc finger MYM-type protein 1-like [Acyrthosiphon pisum]|uniref:DUF4371 domain-containing protein n=1 Tax=Acyrthosiphon pisum TaxID=7029 RepID=A0A8R1X0P2_ACYPI|nr:zinc finger MYM-type protein 1-like [Acyrthosiphon pisum]|eukprot:XP_008178879.1 PREDICTED: zinc finger MYM-type protein 1-like [Acyrthosiphon pisum]
MFYNKCHVDQLSFIFRYVQNNGSTVERFLGFLPNSGHKSEELVDAVFLVLDSHGLDINNCRGQSYDNASNMSGMYTGLQARIKEVNPLATFVPCSAHSLNLVGCLETAIMATLWSDILEKFNKTSKQLQSVEIDLETVCSEA